ncbi:hypothetical protein BX666DRAFT_2022185 [Dichotomocladium elegans]|nr:hypothetical protein BX666DRAFT_2022185 [Dichotomocladium elegans]
MLEHLADNLTSLALTDMKGAFVDITRVLQACPSLCQLSYTIRISNSNSCSTVPCSRPPASCYSLVSLQLQTESRCLFDPTLVLKNCPNLVALTIDNTPLSPTDILTWCPQLELLHMGKKTHCIGMDHPALQLRTKDIKRQQGLRYLYLAENPLFIQGIRQILHAHSQTLQILHLPPSSLIQHPAAAAVSAPAAIEPHRLPDFSSLKILSTVTVQDPHALITLINACPSLEELHILDFGSLSFSVIDTISRFRQSLVKLSFRAQFGYDACSVVKRNSLLSMLPQLTCLTTLVFDYCSLFDGDTAVYLLSRIASLQDLTLGSIAPSDHMKFDALQHLSRLRRLRLRHFLFPSLLHKEQNSWPTLEQLCLIECYISTPDWDPDSILPKMPRLNSFILSKCQGNAMHVIQKYKRWGKVELILHGLVSSHTDMPDMATDRVERGGRQDAVVLWSESFKGNSLYQILRQLSLRNNTFTTLELITPSVIQEDRLIEVLPTQTLQSLTLTKVAGLFLSHITKIIAACPKMIHFAYSVDQREYHTMPRAEFFTAMASSFSLRSLCLSTRPVRHEIMALLRQCPRLEKLVLNVEACIDCQEVMEACPDLVHLHIGNPAILQNVIQEYVPKTPHHPGQLSYFCLGDYKDAVMDKGSIGDSWLAHFASTLRVLHLPDLTTYPFCSESVRIVSCGRRGLDNYASAVRQQFPNARQICLVEGNTSIAMATTSLTAATSNSITATDLLSPVYNHHSHRRSDPSMTALLGQFLTAAAASVGRGQQLTGLDMAFKRLPSRIIHEIAHWAPLLVSLRLDTWHSKTLDLTPLHVIPSLRDVTLVRIDHLSYMSLVAIRGVSSLLLNQCLDVSPTGLVDLVCRSSRLKRLVLVNCGMMPPFDPTSLIPRGRCRGVHVVIKDVDVQPWSYDVPLPNRASHLYYQ